MTSPSSREISWQTVFAWPLVAMLRLYQRWISPLTPPTCRFYPSCSSYAVTALTRYGPIRGGWLALRRLGRCHPWQPGGVDEVPPQPDDSCHHPRYETTVSSIERGRP